MFSPALYFCCVCALLDMQPKAENVRHRRQLACTNMDLLRQKNVSTTLLDFILSAGMPNTSPM